MKFSLFFFSDNGSAGGRDKYRLLLEASRFADDHGFSAVWTPERHFGAFGGLYPNPSVTSAAIAAITRNIGIRAGSVVLPLQDPLRVAEEWSMLDNLSNGRVGIGVGSGWNVNDFVLSPTSYKNAKEVLYSRLDTVQRLWRGETVTLINGAGKEVEIAVFPRPLQSELPVWISGQSEQSFVRAGKIGANVLTHLILRTVPELERNIRAYKDSLARHGHDPRQGQVTLMMHTFLDPDMATARSQVDNAYSRYVGTYLDFLGGYWEAIGTRGTMTAEDELFIRERAVDRLVASNGLVGSPESCADRVVALESLGVTEIACLIDFGIDADRVLASLRHLDALKRLVN